MIDDVSIERDVGLTRSDLLKTRQIAPVAFPGVDVRSSRATPAGPAVEATEVGVPAELANRMRGQSADAVDDLLFAAIAIDR
jgi:hypothetical protein